MQQKYKKEFIPTTINDRFISFLFFFPQFPLLPPLTSGAAAGSKKMEGNTRPDKKEYIIVE